MFALYLPLAFFNFSVKLSSFALASKVRIILHYSHLCAISRVKAILNLAINPGHSIENPSKDSTSMLSNDTERALLIDFGVVLLIS